MLEKTKACWQDLPNQIFSENVMMAGQQSNEDLYKFRQITIHQAEERHLQDKTNGGPYHAPSLPSKRGSGEVSVVKFLWRYSR